ncbi:site-specific integrase [uncultured Roseibium sp.]|uniref:tyrosine-type recombinase/integrase n=1 Tax=uncultured Roseibium sp. TaxID=1936171 RepID=UPI0026381FFE|nr:site-specific integrase [uncultured Roseibium sp.]
MARAIHKLNDVKVKTANKPGRVSDGGGLYLRVSPSGTKSWSFMWKRDGKRDEIGLGRYPDLSLKVARKKAEESREAVALGKNPRELRVTESEEPSFAECVEKFMRDIGKDFSNKKHRDQWEMTLGPTYCAKIQSKRPSEISKDDILGILKPIWATKTETASRLRARIERVLNTARPEEGWKGGVNPAHWPGNLENDLTDRRQLRKIKPVKHHPAMPYGEVPDFMPRLADKENLSARALELLIYTVCRTSEVLQAKWNEVDFESRLWTVPGVRMKMKVPHSIPLTDPAFELLKSLHDIRRNDWIFPGHKKDKCLSGMVLEMQMRRMGVGHFTPHGFRSSFRDWAGDETEFAREVAEGCLAHKVGDNTENAYRRGTAIKKRLNLLTAWANYITGASGEAVQLNQYAG